jgi:predicted acyltransferase
MDADAAPKSSERLLSIDALRGFDMFWIIGGDKLGRMLAALSHSETARLVDEQLEHVPWEGFHFYDLIFPLFLFLVGVVLPFSIEKSRDRGRWGVFWRIARRTALLFALGLLYNRILEFHWENFRWAGVLQRIALCYGIAALIAWKTPTKGIVALLVAILLGYWALLANVAAPGGKPGDYSIAGNLAGWVDRQYLPGRLFYGHGDNEGLLSTIPAVGTALLGVLAGRWLRSGRSPWEKVAGLAIWGAAALVVGAAWGLRFPIIKILWTSSYVLVAGGLSLLLLAVFYAVVDVLRFRRWAFFFAVIGANAITIYIAPKFLNFDYFARFFLGGVYRLAGQSISPGFQQVLEVAGVLAAEWLFLLYLYRNRIFLRV